ncbi:MAG: hypothetical protein ACREJB_09830, partial [Planctomycetaceae bacterium]
VRAHDHLHPVNKRTNYMFGEWDPHRIDVSGNYRRFILRKIILDSLLMWMDDHPAAPAAERLYDAAAVLCGTILMASSISGSGPETHDSNVTLTSLLPRVARQRDAFYERLLRGASGTRARRLQKEARQTRQPFGHVRQYLNMHLAKYGARQVQHRHLAQLYARMGHPDASQREAARIPSASARFESEILWRITSAHRCLGRGEAREALRLIREIDDHLERGTACGALPDPWNVLAFQGQFPLFTSREDSVPDHRIEMLLELMERFFLVYSRALSEAAALGDGPLRLELAEGFHRSAEAWDRYATSAVEDLPRVSGRESFESASHVAEALAQWRAAGEAAGDISFWRQHVEQFESPKAYALVVEALLEKGDHVASMGLMMQWLSQADEVGLEAGPHSLCALLVRWMQLVRESKTIDDSWPIVRRMFDYLEANAGEFWSVPSFADVAESAPVDEEDMLAADEPDEHEEDEEGLFQAAYDQVIYRDSTADGHEGQTLDDGYRADASEFEHIARALEPRLKFLTTLAQLWQIAAASFVGQARQSVSVSPRPGGDGLEGLSGEEERLETIREWRRRTVEWKRGLIELMTAVEEFAVAEPSGDYESNVEYDLQLQMKFYLLHTTITTTAACEAAGLFLQCGLPPEPSRPRRGKRRPAGQVVEVCRGVLRRDRLTVRRAFPRLLRELADQPLLYVSLEGGGDPRKILEARTRQAVIRLLLAELPAMGLLRETWDLLRTAYRMERGSRPEGMAITEYDRLFRIALRESLRCVIRSASKWPTLSSRFAQRRPRFAAGPRPSRRLRRLNGRGRRESSLRRMLGRIDRDDELIAILHELIARYQEQWLKHSGTTQLSTVESLKNPELWRQVRRFIRKYGAELFHARMLTLGNLRAILHNGVDQFLGYLDETRDPLAPSPLLDDLEEGRLDVTHAIRCLELVYGVIVDRFDRFVEYNTTTTQSDYGDRIDCLLDFLRVEAAYDRNAWNLTPGLLAHELLSEEGRGRAARMWEDDIRSRTAQKARRYLKQLQQLESAHGMRLPSIGDRLSERFVQPLAVNRMRALIPKAIDEAQDPRGRDPWDAARGLSFESLQLEIDAYLESRSGSAIDVPPWLRMLEREVLRTDPLDIEPDFESEPELALPTTTLRRAQLVRQLQGWE